MTPKPSSRHSLSDLLSTSFVSPPLRLHPQFTMHQYRLQGPYANPKVAAEVYSRQPKGDFLECSITAAFLGASKVTNC